MKSIVKVLSVSVFVAIMTGCASSIIVPQVPMTAKAHVNEYRDLPDNKVFILAVDANGDFAYGVSSGKATPRAAAKEAVKQCDAMREANHVTAKPYIYAINDKVVYETMFKKAFERDAAASREIQAEEFRKETEQSE